MRLLEVTVRSGVHEGHGLRQAQGFVFCSLSFSVSRATADLTVSIEFVSEASSVPAPQMVGCP